MTNQQTYSTYTQEYQAVIEDLRKIPRVNARRHVRPLELGLLKYDLARIGAGITGFGGTGVGLQVGETMLEKGLYAAASALTATLLYRAVKRRTDAVLEEAKQELANNRDDSLEMRIQKEA